MTADEGNEVGLPVPLPDAEDRVVPESTTVGDSFKAVAVTDPLPPPSVCVPPPLRDATEEGTALPVLMPLGFPEPLPLAVATL